MKTSLLNTLFSLVVLAPGILQASAATCEENFLTKLEITTATRKAVWPYNGEVFDYIKKSQISSKVEELILTSIKTQSKGSVVQIPGGVEFFLRQKKELVSSTSAPILSSNEKTTKEDLYAPIQLIKSTPTSSDNTTIGTNEIVFSSDTLKDATQQFYGYSIDRTVKNPTLALLYFRPNGSIDNSNIYIFDLETKKILNEDPIVVLRGQEPVVVAEKKIFFFGGLNAIANDISAKAGHQALMINAEKTGEVISDLKIQMVQNSQPGANFKFAFFSIESGQFMALSKDFDKYKEIKVIGATFLNSKVKMWFQIIDDEGITSIVSGRVNREQHTVDQLDIIEFDSKTEFIYFAKVLNNQLITARMKGGETAVTIRDVATGNKLHPVIPAGLNLVAVSSAAAQPYKLQFFWLSEIQMQQMTFSLTKRTWEDSFDPLFKKGDLKIESRIVVIKMRDGYMLPVRVTQKKGAELNKSTALYLDVYGSYGDPSDFFPSASPINEEILKRGGLVINPAIRGGGDEGGIRARLGEGAQKEKTISDILDTVNSFFKKGTGSPKFTILTGTSAGALAVATAALDGSGSFGLVIPINGPYDINKITELEPSYFADYNRGKLGDFNGPYWSKNSPMRTARNLGDTNFLIVNGGMDSRVNPIHSQRFVEALKKYQRKPGQVMMLSIDHSGHWLAGSQWQGLISLEANKIIWTRIFDQLGFKP